MALVRDANAISPRRSRGHPGLAKASGIETPTREDLARLDRKRKKKTSNKDWKYPWDPDAKVAKMKDGRTHLAHKAEHAVDLETGAIVAVTLQGADQGDTTTIVETVTAAAEQIEDAQADIEAPQPLEEIIADKGYQCAVKGSQRSRESPPVPKPSRDAADAFPPDAGTHTRRGTHAAPFRANTGWTSRQSRTVDRTRQAVRRSVPRI